MLCRRVRELHFVDIVDVQQLLDVMGQDVAPVAQRIQKLLLPRYAVLQYSPFGIAKQLVQGNHSTGHSIIAISSPQCSNLCASQSAWPSGCEETC